MGRGGASSKLRNAARKMLLSACLSFSSSSSSSSSAPKPTSIIGSHSSAVAPTHPNEAEPTRNVHTDNNVVSKNLCAICLEGLSYSSGTGSSQGQAIFTAQCSHSFHFACISSNVRHGSVTCPICRAHWTQLPRNINPPCSFSGNQIDPIFQILDDSIATFRVHRRSFLRSARYNDDDPVEPNDPSNHPRLLFSLVPISPTLFRQQAPGPGLHQQHLYHLTGSSSSLFSYRSTPPAYSSTRRLSGAYLSVKSTQQRAVDLVMVASPSGPHLRLVKQSMALVVFYLRPIDRLAIVTYNSSFAARVFPLRRMTSYSKRTALQVIDRLFFMEQADPLDGLKKGVKIFEDRAHKNPESCILHLSDSPARSYQAINMQVGIPIHQFHIGFGFGSLNGYVMHDFEEFLVTLLGGVVRDVQLRIGEDDRIIRLGELRANEERRILLDYLSECGHVCVGYSYIEGGTVECIETGETIVSSEDRREPHDAGSFTGGDATIIRGRTSSVDTWDYHDPCMARRWAKYLHGL